MCIVGAAMKQPARLALVAVMTVVPPLLRGAQPPEVPDWALPGSATHQQVPPPAGFHRPTVVFHEPIGVFEGQADVGGPLLPGSARWEPAGRAYFIDSASYNIWYFRDEFRFLWKKMAGDVSLAANVIFPKTDGYGDRKAVLIVRQDLDDDAKEIMTALHGAGLIHLAYRPEKGADLKEACRFDRPGRPLPGQPPGLIPTVRIGIEKHGDAFQLYYGLKDGTLVPAGAPVTLHFDGPFYVGLGFCSHQPAVSDEAMLTNVVVVNAAGQVR